MRDTGTCGWGEGEVRARMVGGSGGVAVIDKTHDDEVGRCGCECGSMERVDVFFGGFL